MQTDRLEINKGYLDFGIQQTVRLCPLFAEQKDNSYKNRWNLDMTYDLASVYFVAVLSNCVITSGPIVGFLILYNLNVPPNPPIYTIILAENKFWK